MGFQGGLSTFLETLSAQHPVSARGIDLEKRTPQLTSSKAKMLEGGSTIRSPKLYKLTIGGGLAFWAANFAISRTPIAAEYRTALSIPYLPMLAESFIAGLIIAFFVSYTLLRFFDKIPTTNPILKSVILSLIVLIIVTILLGVPASFLTPTDPLRYFLIGALFSVLRILALGIVIGYLYKGLYGSGWFGGRIQRKRRLNATKQSPHGANSNTATGVGGVITPGSVTTRT